MYKTCGKRVWRKDLIFEWSQGRLPGDAFSSEPGMMNRNSSYEGHNIQNTQHRQKH